VLPPHTQVIGLSCSCSNSKQPVRTHLDGPLTILQAGRVSPEKGVHVTIEPLGRLARQGVTDVQLVVAGTGPTEHAQRLREIAERCRIADRVTFLGWRPRAEVPTIMARSHVLVLPTEGQEPFARVVLEAMASGLTVVSTLTGGTSEIVRHGETGLTFPLGNTGGPVDWLDWLRYIEDRFDGLLR